MKSPHVPSLDQLESLGSIGFSKEEIRTYRRVLGSPGSTPSAIAADDDAPEDRTLAHLARLEEGGLVTRTPTRPPEYQAAAPQVALEALVQQRMAAMSQVRVVAEVLQDHYAAVAGSRTAQAVELLTGSEAVAARFVQIQQTAQREALTLDRPPYFQAVANNRETLVAAIRRGVRYRTIYDQDALEYPGRLEVIRQDIEDGEQAWYLSELPLKLAIIDDQAIVSLLANPDDQRTLVLDGPALVAGLRRLFELLWERATPLDGLGQPRTDRNADTPDEQLLALLATGMPDKAIARHLGISPRTMARRVHALLRRLDSSSRFQAGIRAAQHGWIPDA